MYNFKRLINKYSKYDMQHEEVVGEKIDMSQGGKVVKDIVLSPIDGALITQKEDVVYDNGGVAKEDVLHLYSYNKLKKNSTIIVDTDDGTERYNVRDIKDYSRFDIGLYIYILERSGR